MQESEFMQIPVGQFADRWQYAAESRESVQRQTIRCATFNIWFDRYQRQQRHAALFELVRQREPDVIAFQEITPASLDQLLSLPWVRESYSCSDIATDTFESYGVVVLSRLPIAKLSLIEFQSLMDRKLVLAELLINDESLFIGGVHLESLRESAQLRIEQVMQLRDHLSRHSHNIVMGDFNMCSSWSQNEIVETNFEDAWHQLHPDLPGYTEDTSVNSMVLGMKGMREAVRFDRVVYRSQSAQGSWVPTQIERLGMEPISADLPNVFPSDHFGLVADFEWRPR
jgi:tyrosyl-DNA phosphodiesterase 2